MDAIRSNSQYWSSHAHEHYNLSCLRLRAGMIGGFVLLCMIGGSVILSRMLVVGSGWIPRDHCSTDNVKPNQTKPNPQYLQGPTNIAYKTSMSGHILNMLLKASSGITCSLTQGRKTIG